MVANLELQVDDIQTAQREIHLEVQRVGESADAAAAMANAALDGVDRLNNRVDDHEQRLVDLERQMAPRNQESDDDSDDDSDDA